VDDLEPPDLITSVLTLAWYILSGTSLFTVEGSSYGRKDYAYLIE